VRRGNDVATRILAHFPHGVDGLADGGAFTSVRGFIGEPQRGITFTASSRNWTASGNSWRLAPSPCAWPLPTPRSAPLRPTGGWRRVARGDGSSSRFDVGEALRTWHTPGALPRQCGAACARRSASVPPPLTPRSPCAPGVQSGHHPAPG
jgi:hypothetical protein